METLSASLRHLKLATMAQSDTNSYIGADLLNYFNTDILIDICRIVKINPELVFRNYESFGGAQYLLKNVSTAFWEKHERDCEEIYSYLKKKIRFYKNTRIKSSEFTSSSANIDFKYFQIWCTDMWSMILNALLFGYNITISDELSFCWPGQKIDEWYNNKIFHNAGVSKEDASQIFFKGFFKEYSPFYMNFNHIAKNRCTIKYVEEIISTANRKRYGNDDFVILILVRIESKDRLRNLRILLNFLKKNFNFQTIIWEIDSVQRIPEDYYQYLNIQYKFIHDDSDTLYRTKYFNRFAQEIDFKYIGYLDCDCVFRPENLIECIEAVTDDFTIALPFDKFFVNIFDKAVIDTFATSLNLEELENSSSQTKIVGSVGGGVIINKDEFLKIGGEIVKFVDGVQMILTGSLPF